MSTRVQLQAEPRTVLGKKVRQLRRSGMLPATVYGNKMEPQSIQLSAHEFIGVLRQAGRTALIDLAIGDQRARPVFVKQTGVDAKRNIIVHVEFYQANLLEKMRSQTPLHFVGESPAVKNEGGIFLAVLDHLEIESLPDDVPAGGIEVDLSQMTELHSTIHVSDIHLPGSVTMITPADEMVAKVDAPVTQAAADEAASAPEAAAEGAGGEASGEAAAES